MSNVMDTDIKFLAGVGPQRAELLEKELGISTYRDMLYTLPFRYVDRSRIYAIRELEADMTFVQVRGRIVRISETGEKRKRRLTVNITDGTGYLELIFFQGIKWMKERLHTDEEYIIFGKVTEYNGRLNMSHPEIEPVSEHSADPCSMTPVYPSTENLKKHGIGIKVFSKLQHRLLENISGMIKETLPLKIRKEHSLCDLRTALKNIHFPSGNRELAEAQRRLKFEELFYLQLSILKQKYNRHEKSEGAFMPRIGNGFNHCYGKLPFPLTGAQQKVIKEIRKDMVSGRQMNRLLQGDVGSGKTAVAFLCCLIAIDNGYQACLMAPTEVLASQHFNGALEFFKGSGYNVGLLTGSTRTQERKNILKDLEEGNLHLLIGTHALIEDNVTFMKLGLAVIDEQHRFGVEQRARLWAKADPAPHVLVMTATPIPRTLAMTVYGDLDISVIDELPAGRKPIKTIHATEQDRKRVYEFMKSRIREGRQIFIVYPLIKESEKMDYQNLEEGYLDIVREFPAPEYITAVVHGKQKNEDKAYDMNLFASGRAHILVATSVIEVGVNVPNASVMVIESAERFGLSQLHQLRGRVGRGSDRAYCILMTSHRLNSTSRQRIDLMCSTQDGFILAEADMRMRGPGDMEGTMQSGMNLNLRISNPSKDIRIMEETRTAAEEILNSDNDLSAPENAILSECLSRLKGIDTDYSEIS